MCLILKLCRIQPVFCYNPSPSFQNYKMSGGVYGGDEVGALVFDPGHFSLRVGYAGEDCPKAEIPSVVGTSPDTSEGDDMDTGDGAKSKKKYHVDTVMLNYPKKDMEVSVLMILVTNIQDCSPPRWPVL